VAAAAPASAAAAPRRSTFDFNGQLEEVRFGDGTDVPLQERLASVAHFSFMLSPAEELKMRELRAAIEREPASPETAWLKSMQDWEMVRFLRGHVLDIKETIEFASKTSAWRAKVNLPEIERRFFTECPTPDLHASRTSPEFFRAYYPSKLLGMSGRRPISLYRMICADFPGLLKESSMQAICDFNIFQLSMSWKLFPQGDGVLIIDLGHDELDTNLPVSSIWEIKSYVGALLKVVQFVAGQVDPAFPESFDRIFFTRPPSVFAGAWKIAQFFVSERTRTKINVLGSTEKSWEPMYKFIPRELLPPFLGGTNEAPFPPGGRLANIPKR
jgi:hypothetical protein